MELKAISLKEAKHIVIKALTLSAELRRAELIERRKEYDCDPSTYYLFLRNAVEYWRKEYERIEYRNRERIIDHEKNNTEIALYLLTNGEFSYDSIIYLDSLVTSLSHFKSFKTLYEFMTFFDTPFKDEFEKQSNMLVSEENFNSYISEILCFNSDSLESYTEFLTVENWKEAEKYGKYKKDGLIEKYKATILGKTQQIETNSEKQKPEILRKQITFKNSETIEKIHTELKGYFPNKEVELLKALQGEELAGILLFPHNQNKFVEVFRRLKYSGFLLNTDTETKNWICSTFQFLKKGYSEPQPFNKDTVWNNLNKGKGEPTKKERICITDWLPYISPEQLEKAAQKEKR